MAEIQWTKEGEQYCRAIPVFSEDWKQLKEKILRIRDRYGFPYWETKKALTNCLGDEKAALDILLKEHQ